MGEQVRAAYVRQELRTTRAVSRKFADTRARLRAEAYAGYTGSSSEREAGGSNEYDAEADMASPAGSGKRVTQSFGHCNKRCGTC